MTAYNQRIDAYNAKAEADQDPGPVPEPFKDPGRADNPSRAGQGSHPPATEHRTTPRPEPATHPGATPAAPPPADGVSRRTGRGPSSPP
ncbi:MULTISPECIES: putative T7SS-secreted protein [unclassified Streptomyces]|uniref:putative T7SS-secreted protein n=1 Tax=unclassified Streptomyces TaxID=2593676 RepID=UPI00315C6EBE